jgi:beta-phosphoglucomutase-like phosphatase (HAD superfamily)
MSPLSASFSAFASDPATATRRRVPRRLRPPRTPIARRRARVPAAPGPPARAAPDLENAAVRWQLALDAAERALRAAGHELPAAEIAQRRTGLARERAAAADLLVHLAPAGASQPEPWISPVPLSPRMLGLPANVVACSFDVEGVLTDAGLLQAWAWRVVLDDYLRRLSEETGWQFEPFADDDYTSFLEGRTRLEGVRAFVRSRGVSLPEGDPADASDAYTACGLARRKGEVLARELLPRGVTALPGARRYLQAAARTGIRRAAVSVSSNALPMLELAGLAAFVDSCVDGGTIRAAGLQAGGSPDALLFACRRMGVPPASTASFTHTETGVAAARAAGAFVVGVGPERELLERAGADLVVPSVDVLLDSRLPLDR